jgi:hypothetical protein
MRLNRYVPMPVLGSSNLHQGTRRVGNAEDVPFPRRVQLAVIAHIRHTHTEYDLLLKDRVSRMVARLRIEPSCLRLLLKWRGEDDEVEIEERTEEVIVIDESDSEDELDYYSNISSEPRDSPEVEILSWKRQGVDLEVAQNTQAMPQHNRPLHRVSSSAYNPSATSARMPEAHLEPPISHTGPLVLAQPFSYSSVPTHLQLRTVIDLTEDADCPLSFPDPRRVDRAPELSAHPVQ